MYTLRTRFKNEIVTEFLPPARATKKQRVIIMCDGAPSVPNKKSMLEFFSKKGFWSFHIHYRGSWESDGKFLAKSPHQDVLDVIEGLPKGFPEYWDNKKFKVIADEIYVIGGSFGGTAAILASLNKKVTKAIAVSGLIDWQRPGPDEPYPKMVRFFKLGFGNGYRFASNGWDKLKSGRFFNPINHVRDIEGGKLLLIHAKDDRTCPYKITRKFASDTKAKLITLPRGDHMSSSILMRPRFYKAFKDFIKS